MDNDAVPPNESGLCECGCGQKTDPSPRNDPRGRYKKGDPKRFINGHQSRVPGKLFEIDPETGCHNWLRYRNQRGYGMMRVPGKKNMQLSHRVFYERAKGALKKGAQLHHKCENPACVNAEHLEQLGTLEHARKHQRVGVEEVRHIRLLYAQGEITQEALAKMFGVSKALISFITTRKYWSDID